MTPASRIVGRPSVSKSRFVCASVLLAGLILLLAVGCEKREEPKTAVVETRAKPAPAPAPGEILVDHDGESAQAVRRLREEAVPLLLTHSYAELDARAAKLRTAKTELANGRWELMCFYEALSSPAKEASQPDWEGRQAQLEEWVKQAPTSITAHVALAQFWADYAWQARGSGWANTVSEEGGRLFVLRLGYAREELKRAGSLGEKCPVYYTALQRVALGQGWSHEDYEALFQEAIRYEPTYASYWVSKSYFLQKRWYGDSDDEWLKFITAEADRLGGEAGNILYARVACYVWSIRTYDNFIKGSGVSWPRLKNGLEACLRRHPDSLWAKSQLCYFSGQKGDRPRCKELFASIGSNVDTEIWDHARFLEDRAWTFRK